MSTGAQLQLAGPACATCPARLGKCVPPEPAPRGARLAIVGEGPGRNELEQGRPFIGASGRMLMRGLQALGLRRGDVHWTNAILCGCAEEDMPAARKACATRLRAELAASGAPVVMPVGAWGLQSTLALARKPQILKWRGSISELQWAENPGSARAQLSGVPILVAPTIHPAFVMRAPKWGAVLECDFERVGRLLQLAANGERWLPPESAPGRRLVIARDRETLHASLRQLASGYCGFDVETVGLGPCYTALVCFALSDGQLTVVVPWSRGRDGRDPWWRDGGKAAAEDVSQLLATRITVTHNGPAFDFIVAQRYGIRIGEWDDSLLMSHAAASHMPKNLAHVVTTGPGALDVPPWKQLEDRTADLERLWTYNGRDTLYTVLRARTLIQELEDAT